MKYIYILWIIVDSDFILDSIWSTRQHAINAIDKSHLARERNRSTYLCNHHALSRLLDKRYLIERMEILA